MVDAAGMSIAGVPVVGPRTHLRDLGFVAPNRILQRALWRLGVELAGHLVPALAQRGL